jgi:ubiquinone/menaquinone biosynthesis C-methylase UbiE
MNTGKVDSVRDYFDDEKRKHPSFLLFDTTPNNFLVPSETYARSLLGELDTGLKILEIGSNDSVDSLTLAGSRNQVWAIEIAKQRLSLARKNVYNSGQVDQVLPICMDAHRLAFPANYFDLVVGNSVLLFLDRERFVSECYRVLKPGGRAIFSNESMKKHPVLLLRRALPQVRARESVAQRITLRDITLISEHSDEIRHSEFYLFSVLLAPIVARFGHFKPVHQAAKLAYKIDDLILRLIPALRDHCWICVLEFRKTPI